MFVLSPEHASELLKTKRDQPDLPDLSYSELIPGEVREFHIADYSKLEDIEHLIHWHWQGYLESGQVNIQTERWSEGLRGARLVNVLDLIPVYSDLQPVNYRTLEGSQLSEPTKSLSVLKTVIEKAKATARGQVPRVNDGTFDEIVASVTGFPIGRDRDRVLSSIRKGLPFKQRGKAMDISERLVRGMDPLNAFRSSEFPAYELCIPDREKRRRFARKLAEKLLGSKDAFWSWIMRSLATKSWIVFPIPRPFVGCLGRCKGFHGG